MNPELPISSELVDMVLSVMQHETPVNHPWFFISPYLSILMHQYDEKSALQSLTQLFGPQFERIKWLFIPICKKNHWVLFAVDLRNVEMHYYTSLDVEYMQYHWHTMKWLKEFLSWRTCNAAWKDVGIVEQKCPQQAPGSMNCAIFLLRYVYNLITETPMNFTQDDISKERVVLAMKLLTHPNNSHQRFMK